MICKNCGNTLREGARFCNICGAAAEQAPQQQVQTAPEQAPQQQAQPIQVQQQYYGGSGYQQPYTSQMYSAYNKPTNGMAIAGFVCSLLSLVGFSFFIITNTIGLILSVSGLKKSRETDGSGRGLAIAGIVCGAISLAFSVIALIIIIIAVVAAASVSSSIPYYYW